MDDRVAAEVDEQHRLLARWLGSASDPGVLDALREAHTDDFSMVTADGQVLARNALLDSLAAEGNSRPGLHILIGKVEVVAELAGTVVTRFLETHVEHGHTTVRRVTALLQADDRARNGLRWRYVHETPIG